MLLDALREALSAVPAWNWSLQALGVVAGYMGAELNAGMRIEGFFVWLVSNLALGVLHACTGQWLLLVLDVLFFRVGLVGIRKWARERPETLPAWARSLLRQA